LQQVKSDARRFYDFDRFDIDYLSDAVLFSKADNGTPAGPSN
jgi:hypothetical protein